MWLGRYNFLMSRRRRNRLPVIPAQQSCVWISKLRDGGKEKKKLDEEVSCNIGFLPMLCTHSSLWPHPLEILMLP